MALFMRLVYFPGNFSSLQLQRIIMASEILLLVATLLIILLREVLKRKLQSMSFTMNDRQIAFRCCKGAEKVSFLRFIYPYFF